MGAQHAGMQSAWVNRKNRPWDTFGGEPDLTVGTFHELADALGAPDR
jgi:2-haloacid dehalogenase